MRKLHSVLKLNLIAIAAFTSGCGGGGPSATPQISKPTVTVIDAYEVTGSYTQAGRTDAPIAASVNNGRFVLSWQVSGPDLYHVDAYLSADSTLDTQPGGDIDFFSKNCGSDSFFECDRVGDFECNFTMDNRLDCGGTNNRSIDAFVASGLPKPAYFIMQACDGLFESCATSARAITLE